MAGLRGPSSTVELCLIQGIQLYLIFENRAHGSKVAYMNTPQTLTHWWRYRAQCAGIQLGEKNLGTVPKQCAKCPTFFCKCMTSALFTRVRAHVHIPSSNTTIVQSCTRSCVRRWRLLMQTTIYSTPLIIFVHPHVIEYFLFLFSTSSSQKCGWWQFKKIYI